MGLVEGNTIRLSAEFKDWDDSLTDPSGVTVKIYDYYDNLLHEATTPAIENPDVGKYYYDYEVEATLPHYFIYSGEIAGADATQKMYITVDMRLDDKLKMSVTNLINKAEFIVEESWTEDEWIYLIDSVLRDMNSSAKILNDVEYSAGLTAGHAYVTLPSDLYEIHSVSYKPDGKRSVPLKRVSAMDTASVGFYRDGTTLYLQNLPYSNGKVQIKYYIELRVFEDGGDNYYPLPDKYEHVLLKGLQAMAMQKEEELDRKKDFFSEYMMLKQEMLNERRRELEPWYSNTLFPTGGQ